ncbi:hypothetical protein M409DRAFT_23786 [Zasmidium cellare ATCC 36951]|uniref:O-methyltransferase n=1 Tax=Zasmidium cellare ATCC 36951 TaxID=1080233 RepID=A0A6A6CIP6_ZASCE|nr:uncharacterized protein M409DRAFT_23786 [Zasmidium cellare ATCC 36951]KAF2166058.1 hypothetical protein M409DRAFT_23786 [Zasmidium cellare ATCC 36951]
MSFAAEPNPPSNALDVLIKSAIKAPTHVFDLLRRLHQLSLDQELVLKNDQTIQNWKDNKELDADQRKHFFDNIMRDKFIALTPDKSIFMYNLARASGALNVVECGTSYGVSTIYLALAVGQNAVQKGVAAGDAKVIATENEPLKAEQARRHWKEAGESVERYIQLREGDLTKTLQADLPSIDFVLFDIWTPMVMPTLRILEPKLKAGAILIADNTAAPGNGYGEFLDHLRAEAAPYSALTLPYQDGLELAVYTPRS